MKINFTKTLFVFCAGILCMSCNNDFLERYPENAISDGAVWNTAKELQMYVNNFYNNTELLPNYANTWGYGPYSVDRDNGSDTQLGRDFNSRMNGDNSIPATGGGWGYANWTTLRNINYFFANYTKAKGDQAEINKFVGEALFFRAIFYFSKLIQFGDLPWYDHSLTPNDEDLYKPRDPRNVVVEHLMDDLDKAVSYLPSRGTAATWTGRVNKETAMILQARIALFEGTWEKYHAGTPFGVNGSDGQKFLEKAKDVTEALIALGTCDLDNKGVANGYASLFIQQSYSTSKEVVFWREFNAAAGLSNNWNDFTPYGGQMGLSQRMVDYYLMNDGKPIEGHPSYKGDNTLLNLIDGRDPRLNQTIYTNDGKHFPFAGQAFVCPRFDNNDKGCTTGYQVFKSHLDAQLVTAGQRMIALIYYRYAEALLINAEAKAELGTITQADLDKTVNLLRRRLVGMADMKLTDVNALPVSTRQFPALSNIINEIRRERTVELACEGFRVNDIFRWAAAGILIRDYIPRGAKRAQWEGVIAGSPPGFDLAIQKLKTDENGYILPFAAQANFTGYKFNTGRDYLLPLNTQELNLFPNLKPQNPGWGGE